jgi:hypothetical protein
MPQNNTRIGNAQRCFYLPHFWAWRLHFRFQTTPAEIDPMAGWQQKVVSKFGPPISLCGATFSDWQRVLKDNGSAVDAPYSCRAVALSLGCLSNSVHAWLEKTLHGSRIAKIDIKPPIFILGHWRTGTTHLHYLLARDQRFATPNTYQVSYPHTFLITEKIGARLGGLLIPSKRPMDEVHMSFQTPNEDEFAICQMTLCSPYLGFTFPRRQPHYDQFLTLRSASATDIAQWKSALVHFLKKLTLRYDRPLVLKSPPHTCRIRILLELFPSARFIHLHRNPYTVFQSTRHWIPAAGPWFHLQRPNYEQLDERILHMYREMYDAFFEERALIPANQFHEVGFEELEQDPMSAMRKIYERLDLPSFDLVEPVLAQYLSGLAAYRKNVFPALSANLRERIASDWRPSFREWGYAV